MAINRERHTSTIQQLELEIATLRDEVADDQYRAGHIKAEIHRLQYGIGPAWSRMRPQRAAARRAELFAMLSASEVRRDQLERRLAVKLAALQQVKEAVGERSEPAQGRSEAP